MRIHHIGRRTVVAPLDPRIRTAATTAPRPSWQSPPPPLDSKITVPSRPGIGLAWNEEVVRWYAL